MLCRLSTTGRSSEPGAHAPSRAAHQVTSLQRSGPAGSASVFSPTPLNASPPAPPRKREEESSQWRRPCPGRRSARQSAHRRFSLAPVRAPQTEFQAPPLERYAFDPAGNLVERPRGTDPNAAYTDYVSDTAGYAAGVNPHAYCGGNPVTSVDPLGADRLNTGASFFGGWGDALSLGGTKWGRKWIGEAAGIASAGPCAVRR